MDKQLSVTDAARNFSDVVNRAYYRGETTVLLRSGQPVAKITPIGPAECTGSQLAHRLNTMHHLSSKEAEAFADDLEAARMELNQWPSPAWE